MFIPKQNISLDEVEDDETSSSIPHDPRNTKLKNNFQKKMQGSKSPEQWSANSTQNGKLQTAMPAKPKSDSNFSKPKNPDQYEKDGLASRDVVRRYPSWDKTSDAYIKPAPIDRFNADVNIKGQKR